MKRLNKNRFRDLSVWMLVSMKREMTTIFVALIAVFMLFHGVAIYRSWGRDAEAFYNNIHASTGSSMFLIACMQVIFIIIIFNIMKTKEQRLRYLMLPASNLEKFLVRWLYVFVVLPVVGTLAFITADALLSVITLPFPVPYCMSGCTQMWENLTTNHFILQVPDRILIVYMFLSFGAMIDGYVLLCSTLFRRPLIMTIICTIILVTIIVTIGEKIPDYVLSAAEKKWIVTIISTVFLAFSMLFTWLSYKIFCRMQVIHHKWINL